ncbi:MAG: FAD:protein FMN transferase [Anaerolineales bacterium]
MVKIEFRSMGSNMRVVLEEDTPQARQALSLVPVWFEGWEACLSRFRPDSELNELNRHAGQWEEVSPVMWELLVAGLRAEHQSGGLVTPALQGVLAGYGYDRSFELIATLDTAMHMTDLCASPLPGMSIQMDAQGSRVLLPEGTLLDFGGIAKGWAADRTLELLEPFGAALVDAGGDIATSKTADERAAWPVGVTDPFAPDETLVLLELRGEAVATSGRDVHIWMENGASRHHIIDPRSGEPAVSRVLTATVIAPTAVKAEVGAKCALILGEVEGKAWLDARPELAGMLVLEDGAVVYSETFKNYLWSD